MLILTAPQGEKSAATAPFLLIRKKKVWAYSWFFLGIVIVN